MNGGGAMQNGGALAIRYLILSTNVGALLGGTCLCGQLYLLHTKSCLVGPI